MDKKKAVKLATASAVAASAFVAANPHASQAATDVATVVSQAKAQMKQAYYTYSHTVTETGQFPDINDVYAAYNKAKQAYANAVAVVNKAGGAKKDAYLADLQATYETYVFKANPKSGEARVATYIDAYNYATKLDAMRQELKAAVDAKDLKKAEELYHKISYELKTRTVILDRVYGQTTRELLRSTFKADAQALRDSLIYDITVAMKAREAQDAVKAGNLDKAKAALDQVNQYVSKVTDAFKAELQKAAQDANAAYEAALTPKVESVSAINAKQIEVKFNTKMDKDSVTDVTKYAIKRAGVASVALTNNSSATDATASLSEDGKTLTITLNNALTSPTWSIAEGDSFNFEIGKLKAANGKEIEAQSVSIKYSDKVAPNLVSATAKAATTTRTVTLKFSEPVDFATTGVFKVNGQVATPSAGSDVREVVLTTSQSLTAGQKYTVEVTNLKDLAGNLITPNPVSLDFTVTQDNTADGIDSVTVQGDNQVKVVFKEPMDSSTVTAAGNIKLVDANGNAITNVSVAPVANSNNKEYTITVGQGTNLYANADTNTVNVIFTNAIKDASGNAITPETRTVTFTKDKVAPKVSKVQLIAPGDTYDGVAYANGALLLTFDEKVLRPADGGTPGNFTKSKIQVIDQDGTDITDALFGAGATISGTVLDSKDNAKLVIPFTAAPASTVKTATVRLVASAVTDASLGANGNAAATVTGVDFTTSVADTQKPVISAASVAGGPGNTITFTITEANLDKSTVLDINNYRLYRCTLKH